MKVFKEQDREFSFPDDWQVLHYDEHQFRKQHMSTIEAVDFVAIPPDGELLLIEVKDFRGYSAQNRRKIQDGSLFVSVGKKVVATVAGLLSGHFRRNIAQYEPYASRLHDSAKHVKLIVVIEHEYQPGDRCTQIMTERDQLKRYVRWLDRAHAIILDGSGLQTHYGIEVRNLPRQS